MNELIIAWGAACKVTMAWESRNAMAIRKLPAWEGGGRVLEWESRLNAINSPGAFGNIHTVHT